MQVVILGGGKGTRLRERLGGRPKPLVEIAGRPLLDIQLSLLKRYLCTDVHLLLGYGAAQIRDFCGRGDQWGLSIHVHEESIPAGTAGAVLNVLDLLAEQFVVMYGDTLLDVDLQRFISAHRQSRAEISLLLHPNDHPADSDLVELDQDHFVQAFHSYPHPPGKYFSNLVNAALYVVNKGSLLHLVREERELDFGKHVFPELLREGKRIYGYRTIEYIKDIGTPDRLDKAVSDYQSGRILKRSLSVPKGVIFLDRDGTMNEHKGHICSPNEFDLFPGAALAIKSINQAGMLSVVVTNQPVIARGELSEEELRIIHRKMDSLLGKQGAFVDALYYCPHHPDRGFPGENQRYKIVCECRKPELGLLYQAQRDLNIDFSQSWFIGDTTRDIETARRAKIRSILLHTGEAGMDLTYSCRPDFEFGTLKDAVRFILSDWEKVFFLAREHAQHIGQGDIVLVGGTSESVSHIFASSLKYALVERGIGVMHCSEKSWLLRSGAYSGSDEKEVLRLADCNCVVHKHKSNLRVGLHKANPSDVVIVNGAQVCANDALLRMCNHSCYVFDAAYEEKSGGEERAASVVYWGLR